MTLASKIWMEPGTKLANFGGFQPSFLYCFVLLETEWIPGSLHFLLVRWEHPCPFPVGLSVQRIVRFPEDVPSFTVLVQEGLRGIVVEA